MIDERMYGLGNAPSAIRELFAYGLKRKAEIGEDKVFDYSIGNPSVPAPQKVADTIEELMKLPPVELHAYSPAAGIPAVRQTIADSIARRYGIPAKAGRVYMTVGAAASIAISLGAVTNAGDEVIVPSPYFPEYKVWIETMDCSIVEVPTQVPSFQLDVEAMGAAINEKTAAVIINSPNNPSGAVYSAETLRQMADMLLQKEKEFGHEIWLISDEPYREIAFDGKQVPYASLFYPRTISCYSFSKSLSVPGERIGYVAVNPESGVSAMLVNMCGQISRGIGHNCPSSVIQLAAADCCDLTSDLSVYETNMNILYDALTDLGFDIVRPGGTFYLFPKALEDDAAAFSKKALPYGLILVPSDSFGVPGYFRIAFCTDTEKVVRSIDAFKKFVKAEYR